MDFMPSEITFWHLEKKVQQAVTSLVRYELYSLHKKQSTSEIHFQKGSQWEVKTAA